MQRHHRARRCIDGRHAHERGCAVARLVAMVEDLKRTSGGGGALGQS